MLAYIEARRPAVISSLMPKGVEHRKAEKVAAEAAKVISWAEMGTFYFFKGMGMITTARRSLKSERRAVV